jgi:N-acyl amino acid synthase of PEP-CTERM/exosortase system
MNDIVAAFNEYFKIIDADSPELLRDVFHLRYQVLCIEQRLPGFEAWNYPAEMESDDYDRHSSHVLLQHRPSGGFLGTARLILPDSLNPNKPFPIEQHTQFDPALFDISKLSRQNTAEVSRLLILRRFRQRRSDGDESDNKKIVVEDCDTKKQRRFPHPILALVAGLMRMSVEHNITHWFSVMDPSLNRLLGLYSLQFDAIGPLTDYHGPRRPYCLDLIKMLDRMHKNHNPIWELITDFGRIKPLCVKNAAPASSYHQSCRRTV